MSKRVTATYEEFLASLPADEQRAIKKRSAEMLAEYEALIAADRASGKVPPEDMPIDESLFSTGSLPRQTDHAKPHANPQAKPHANPQANSGRTNPTQKHKRQTPSRQARQARQANP